MNAVAPTLPGPTSIPVKRPRRIMRGIMAHATTLVIGLIGGGGAFYSVYRPDVQAQKEQDLRTQLTTTFLDLHAKSTQLTAITTELTNKSAQLATTSAELNAKFGELEATSEQLAEARKQLSATQEELANAQEQLAATSAEANNKSVQLVNTDKQLTIVSGELAKASHQLLKAAAYTAEQDAQLAAKSSQLNASAEEFVALNVRYYTLETEVFGLKNDLKRIEDESQVAKNEARANFALYKEEKVRGDELLAQVLNAQSSLNHLTEVIRGYETADQKRIDDAREAQRKRDADLAAALAAAAKRPSIPMLHEKGGRGS
ncbi:MAG: hypothetical protein AB7G80_08930 [Dongiaceae bacterium]